MTTAIEPILSFFEGLALIASPCILPVLPLVLSASVDGGRKRPFGIIIGFVLAFTVFAFASRKLVTALGIDLDYIKKGSLIFLAFFGLVLFSEKLSEKFSSFTQKTANIGGALSTGNQDGLFSGIVIGALIGLIWTPCAGPILAAVLVQVIRQESDLASLFIILPFAIGAGIPMLIIALTGRKAVNKLSFFTEHAEGVRKTFGVIILLAVAFIATGMDPQTFFTKKTDTAVEMSVTKEATTLVDGLDKPYAAPEFADLQGWLNSQPLLMSQLKGKVVLIDFWTYSCINCVRTLPYITSWYKKYRDDGLVIIGLHAPEFEFEKKTENVKAAIAAHDIKYPVALDNNLSTWSNFHNQYWPAHYLINKEGRVVYTHFGEGKYDVTENNIRFLLGLKNKVAAQAPESAISSDNQTPETYLGYGRAESYEGRSDVVNDQTASYDFSNDLSANAWSLQGKWTVHEDKIVTDEKAASLRLNFNARKVFLVLGNTSGKPITVSVHLNGLPAGDNSGADTKDSTVTVDKNTLYELIDQKSAKQGLLEIRASEPGLEAYAFTFGE